MPATSLARSLASMTPLCARPCLLLARAGVVDSQGCELQSGILTLALPLTFAWCLTAGLGPGRQGGQAPRGGAGGAAQAAGRRAEAHGEAQRWVVMWNTRVRNHVCSLTSDEQMSGRVWRGAAVRDQTASRCAAAMVHGSAGCRQSSCCSCGGIGGSRRGWVAFWIYSVVLAH